MRLALSASLMMLTGVPAFAVQVKWVPLDQAQRGPKKPVAAAPVASPSSAPVAEMIPAPVAPPETAQPVPPQAPPSSSVATGAGSQQPLQITCFGGGTANKPTAAFGWGNSYASGNIGSRSWSGSGFGTTTVYGTRQQGFGDQVDVRLFSGDDRIRMPRTMLPAIRGGKNGWFKLKDVVADARSIRASAAVNAFNNPKVFIDRVTGTISISGKAGDYAGQCQAIDTSAPARF